MIWYGDGMFGKLYEELEFRGAKKTKSVSFSMRGVMVTALVKSMVLHSIYMLLGFTDLPGAVVVALLLSTLDTCGLMDDYLFTNNPLALTLIHVGGSFASNILVMAVNWALLGV